MSKTKETKGNVFTLPDGIDYAHNTLYTINNNFLGTISGITDAENQRHTCIGDQVHLVGVTFAVMLTLNEHYSDVTFRLMVIRTVKGKVPKNTTLLNNASGNKMLDIFNTERYLVLFTKYVKMVAANTGMIPANIRPNQQDSTEVICQVRMASQNRIYTQT